MSKRGLPTEIKMRHDSHYVEDLARSNRTIGKIIPINRIEPNPEQPRVEIGDLSELTESIRQKGVLEPLLVKPNNQSGNWMIIAGERRWRAANLAGLREVPCIELDLDDKAVAEIALIENLQRKDLTVWEEADGLAALAKQFGYKHDEIAKKISKSRTSVTESMAIAGIPDDIREKCRAAGLNGKSTLLEIARQFDDAAMHEFVGRITARNLSREELRKVSKPSPTAVIPSDKSKKTARANNFKYISKSNGFSLSIDFDTVQKPDRKQILQALKEVFEHVKNNND